MHTELMIQRKEVLLEKLDGISEMVEKFIVKITSRPPTQKARRDEAVPGEVTRFEYKFARC